MEPNSNNNPPQITGDQLTNHLPLPFLKPELIPPAPNHSQSGTSIDFLPDFFGYAWVGYGASSLLVISHFPSPLSSSDEEGVLTGPIFRQVSELCNEDEAVNAVSWSQVTPSKGEIAAAASNRVFVLSCDLTSGKGSFCWSQTAVLLQVSEVVAIKWTGSGDGIVTGGSEVVLWKRREKSWERAWKFKTQQPQTLVSATFSIEGPSATASTYPNEHHVEGSFPVMIEAAKCVSVCQSFGKSEYVKAELHHPQPVSMIQWRPITGNQLNREVKQTPRNVLLTCCRDGAARLWCETDNGRPKKYVKDGNDQKSMKLSFCVVAVIEMNQTLCGSLGIDIFIAWPTEVESMFKTHEGASQCSSTEAYEGVYVPRCEWLVGFGPGLLLTFWAIHCLDDFSPVRFPRVTLWNKQEVPALQMASLGTTGVAKESTLNKVLIARNTHFAPPTICSLIRLLPCNSLGWSLIYTNASNDVQEEEASLSYQTERYLDIDGHCGKILRVAVHSYCLDIELAASLDSNGRILLWSLSKSSNNFPGLPTLNPAWKLCGNLICGTSCSKYTSLTWAPLGNEDQFLLLGHASGIDCFVVRIVQSKEKVEYQNLCTIPFTSHATDGDGAGDIFSIPLHSNCNESINSGKFILLGVWMKEFQALSLEISLHCCTPSGSCCKRNLETKDSAQKSVWTFETSFADKYYCFNVNVRSSELPEMDIRNHVTSYAVPTQANQIFIRQVQASNDVNCFNDPPFHLATGFYDGSVKLWRSNPHLPWEVVGVFAAHLGPVSAISSSGCGQKIATVCMTGHPKDACSLRIWDSIQLSSSGSFFLEELITLEDVIGLSWLTTENGQSLLEVSMKNQLQVYGQQRCGGQSTLRDGNISAKHVWVCLGFILTSSTLYDFLWRPSAAAVVVHGDYFGLIGQWLFVSDHHHRGASNQYSKDIHRVSNEETDKELIATFFSDNDDLGDPKNGSRKGKKGPHVQVNVKNSQPSNNWFLGRAQVKCGLITKLGSLSILEVAEKLLESLPIYHPEALLMNICSGNWRRASTAMRHLAKHLPSSCSSEAIPQIDLSDYFEGQLPDSFSDKRFHLSGNDAAVTSFSLVDRSFTPFAYNAEPDAYISTSMQKTEGGSNEPLEKLVDLEGLSNLEKTQIFSVKDLLKEISDPHLGSVYRGLDIPGQRFWVAVRYKQLYFRRKYNRLASMEELLVDSSMFAWAFHSDCQENLFTSVLPNEPSWQEMRNVGVGFWFTDTSQLRTKMEKLARFQYLTNRDPKACALLYIALKRIQVLAGLFKISKDEKDKPLVGFLSRNFQEEKNKAAALKNAYVLMGRHQLELAIAFFLLGGDTSSAVTICAKNLGDEQLALVICRLIEGHGGPLERDIISKYILPSAIERGDYWLASLLEWELGTYSQSFLIMLGIQKDGPVTMATLSSLSGAFSDPSVGQFCSALATKNSMRNAVGEHESAILSRWASSMTATALNRCGLPLEGLECISSSQNDIAKDHKSIPEDDNSRGLCKILNTLTSESPNWLSGDVAFHLESHSKLNLAIKYLTQLIWEHPCWPDNHGRSSGGTTPSKEFELHQYQTLLENFRRKFYTAIANLEKFFLSPAILVKMILVSLCNKELFYIGYDILHGFTLPEQSDMFDGSMLHPLLQRLLLKANKEMAHLFSHFIIGCTLNFSQSKVFCSENNVPSEIGSFWLDSFACTVRGIIQSVWTARVILGKLYSLPSKDHIKEPFIILYMVEYCIYFSAAWIQRNLKGLVLMVQPLRIKCDGGAPTEIDMETLKKLLHQMAKLVFSNPVIDTSGGELQVPGQMLDGKVENLKSLIPVDERWQTLGVCLWQQLSNFIKLYSESESESESGVDGDSSSGVPLGALSSGPSGSGCVQSDVSKEANQIRLESVVLVKFLKITLEFVYSFYAKQLRLLLQQKVEQGLHTKSLVWLDIVSQSQPVTPRKHLTQDNPPSEILNNGDEAGLFDKLWDTCTDSDTIKTIAQENVNVLRYKHKKPFKTWVDVYDGLLEERQKEETHNQEGVHDSNPSTSQAAAPRRGLFRNGPYFSSNRQKDAISKGEGIHFKEPKEIYKINGELFEALCINSTDQRQVALASNRKGILFIHREDGMHSKNHSDYIWSKADWPQNGWAGSESTPVPTCVSPGIGLGTKKGAHLGLGGATVGVGSLARPGRDLTGGGAFGIPGYAGMGASGLGWETQEDFEEFVDPPADVRNISTRAFSSHPSRPYFLVGSSNTHVYLWEFGKIKAIATYGVLPAANVAPPYALASISAVEFDHYGHRFATAALDGTICTWQLEVGGRSNVRPTESSLCFNSHASDVTYVTSSGSIIAASGYSTDGVNVVVWDTLAPLTSSRASIMCHEGGARSLSVFDNVIGSGSVSPLIVTGGRGGDIGLHDFRYIATGKTKRHRHLDNSEHKSRTASSGETSTSGNQNINGMLWYLPKAHIGSITKISTIPNTSLFLTGSKDGDVKLWDAQKAKLVYHWPKLHERHTFLQPSSRGFGGVVQAAVTDLQVIPQGFLSCGGDGSVKHVHFNEHLHGT